MPNIDFINYYFGIAILCACFAVSFSAMTMTKYKAREMAIFWVMAASVYLATVIVFTISINIDDYNAFARYTYVIGASVFSLVCLLVSNNSMPERLFLIITNITMFIILNYFSFAISFNAFAFQSDVFIYWAAVAIRTVLYVIYISMYLLIIKKRLPKIEYKHSGRWWPYVFASIVFLVMFVYLAMVEDTSFDFTSYTNIIIFGVMTILFVIIYIALLASIKNLSKLERMALVEQNEKYMKQQIDYLNASNEEMKKIRHDIRHHNMVIYNLAKNGDNRKIVEYINEYDKTLDAATYVKMCQNETLNAILSSYKTIYENEMIEFECAADVPSNVGIDDIDLVIIFANMLENALHGIQEAKTSKKYCNLSIKTKNEKLVVLCENTCSKKVKVTNGRLDDEGVGISSIKSSINKYGGNIEYSRKDDLLTVKAILNINKIEK